MGVVLVVTQVEVVLHAVTKDQDTANSVDKGNTGGVLAVEVAGLVATDEAGRLDSSGRATGKASVEGHNTLHAGGILGGTDGVRGGDLGGDQGRETSAGNVAHLV